MEYVTYILIIFTISLVFFALLRRSSESEVNRKPGGAQADRAGQKEAEQLKFQAATRTRVPTPWGWPGHHDKLPEKEASALPDEMGAASTSGVSDSLQRWVDRLVSEKRTVEDQEYMRKKDASLRALLEDRYGNASRIRVNGKPAGRAPNASPEGNGEPGAERLRANGYGGEKAVPNEPGKRSRIRDVKTPWGW